MMLKGLVHLKMKISLLFGKKVRLYLNISNIINTFLSLSQTSYVQAILGDDVGRMYRAPLEPILPIRRIRELRRAPLLPKMF